MPTGFDQWHQACGLFVMGDSVILDIGIVSVARTTEESIVSVEWGHDPQVFRMVEVVSWTTQRLSERRDVDFP